MTALINDSRDNTTSGTCSICHEDFREIEKMDTKKIVELACHHFYHMQCIGSWFSHSENQTQDLSCYCNRFSIERFRFNTSFTPENLTAYFEEIKGNPIYQSDSNTMACVARLSSLVEPLSDFLNDIVQDTLSNEGRNDTENRDKFVDWIKNNLDREFQQIAVPMIVGAIKSSNVVINLQKQIEHLAKIPSDQWPVEIQESGASAFHSMDELQFRLRVSKEYLERSVTSYVCNRMQNPTLFKSYIEQLKRDNYYDDKVLEAIPYVKNLQRDFSQLLKNNPVVSREEILSLLEERINKIEANDDLKETVGLIMNKFLFRLGALRTLSQEIKRWEKESSLPPIIRHRGVRVLDENDPTKHYQVENFKSLIANKKANDLKKPLLIIVAIGVLATSIFDFKR